MIEQQKVSRQHAEVVRKGNLFILRDLGSSNGTWSKDERVGEMILQDGDIFRIGQARVVFVPGMMPFEANGRATSGYGPISK